MHYPADCAISKLERDDREEVRRAAVVLRNELATLRKALSDANSRLQWVADCAAWHRSEEGRTHLAVQVSDFANLSTAATRRDALHAAFRAAHAETQTKNTT